MVQECGSLPRALSVVMPVRNAGPFLDASMSSILDQSFADFEFVIRDDGSTDGSTGRLEAWAARDPRIRLFVGSESLGPAASSNWVVANSSGRLVARMDADDVAHPDRLKRQIEALAAAPSACLVGTLWEGIDEQGRHLRPRDRWRLSRSSPFSPFPHGSIMFRRDAFDRAGGYRAEANLWEDADLYMRMAEVGSLLVLPDALYFHRSSALSTRLTSDQELIAPGNSAAVGLAVEVKGAFASATVTIDPGLGGALQGIRDALRARAGPIATSQNRLTVEKADIADDRAKLETRSSAYYNKLLTQFTAMERRVSAFKATQTYLEQQIKAWSGGND